MGGCDYGQINRPVPGIGRHEMSDGSMSLNIHIVRFDVPWRPNDKLLLGVNLKI